MNPSASPQAAPGKSCGTCMMCCKLPLIKELEKPSCQWCRHVVIGKGCGIYADRPQVCRSFHCQWILDAGLGPEWKPEKAKFIIYLDREKAEVINVSVDPAYPDAWTKPSFFTAIKKWITEGADLGRMAMVYIGARWVAVLPDRILELGRVGEEGVLQRERSPTGRTIGLHFVPPSPPTPAAAPVHPES
jgi:hypothetical protein